MKNIELKVRLDNSKRIISDIRKIGAKFKLRMHQVDTYYNCKTGHIKMRENNNKDFELIFYQRPDKMSSRISNYFLLKMKRNKAEMMKNILSQALGVRNIIRKIRNLWIYKNTRIHIDKVDGLGNFLELETVVGNQKIEMARIEHKKLIELLALSKFKKVSKSYTDLKR